MKRYMELSCSQNWPFAPTAAEHRSPLCVTTAPIPTKQGNKMRIARASKWSCVVVPTKQHRKLVKTDKKLVTVLCKEWGSGHRQPCLVFCLQYYQALTKCMGTHELQVSSSKLEWSMFNPALAWCTRMAWKNPWSWRHLGTSSTGQTCLWICNFMWTDLRHIWTSEKGWIRAALAEWAALKCLCDYQVPGQRE